MRLLLKGSRRPPENVATWAHPLGCNASERQLLIDLAAVAYLPPAFTARFTTLVQDSAHLREIRGTMILADQIFQDNLTGKWIVAGTYSRWWETGDELVVPSLQCYLRLQVERPGHYPGRLWCLDRAGAPTENKLWDVPMDFDIPAQGLPVFEARVILPGCRVRAPVPQSQRKAGEAYALQTAIWLRVGNTEVASCPLDFIFTGPSPAGDAAHDPSHHDRPNRR